MAHDLFDRLCLYGFDPIGPAIAAAMVSYQPILFVSIHGENKTEGARILAEAMMGSGVNYQVYTAPLLTPEMFLGYPSPKGLMEDQVRYIETDESAWNVEVVNIDEINRANEQIAGRLMEWVRTGKIGTRRTKVRYRFATANPPRLYNAGFMDPAFASRFLVLQPPDDGNQEVLRKVIRIRRTGKQPIAEEAAKTEFKNGVIRARKVELSGAEMSACENCVLRIAKELRDPKLKDQFVVGKRQWADMVTTLFSLRRLDKTLYKDAKITDEQIVLALLGHFPEAHGLLRRQADAVALRAVLAQAVKPLRYVDESRLTDRLKAPPSAAEQAHWSGIVVEKLRNEEVMKDVKTTARRTARWLKAGQLEAPVANAVLTACVNRMIELSPRTMDEMPVGADRGLLAEALMKELVEVAE